MVAEEQRPEPVALERPETLEQAVSRDPAGASRGLGDVLALYGGKAKSLPDGVQLTAIRAVAEAVRTAAAQGQPLRLEALTLPVECLESWRQQSEEIAAEALDTLEAASVYLLATSPQLLAQTLPLLVARVVTIQRVWPPLLLRALAMRTAHNLLAAAGVRHCNGILAAAIEPPLAAAVAAATAPSEPASFALLVFSICALAPLAEDPSGLPQLSADHTGSLLSMAASALHHAQRDSTAAAAGRWDCGATGGVSVVVERRHLLIFFTALPRLQTALSDRGLAASDRNGDTVLHWLAASSLSDCLHAYLRGCSPSLDTSLRNKAGLTAAEVAAAHGHGDYVAGLESFPASATPLEAAKAEAARAGRPTLPLLMHGVARAMARASSVPLPPQGPPSESGSDRQLPSLSWIGPDTAPVHASQEERLGHFEAQAQAQRPRMPSRRGGAGAPSPAGSRQASQRLASGDLDRRHILELALAGLNNGSAGGSDDGGEGGGTDRSWASAALQNPGAPLQVDNPFASYTDVHSRLDAQRGQLGLPPQPPQLPGGGFGSMGSYDLEGRLASVANLRQGSVCSERGGGEDKQAGRRADDCETAAMPSTRMWLGNIAAHVTVRSLYDIFGTFGQVADAAVFPARIGPLGYAFVNFMRLDDATRAHDALNNTSVPPLTGSKLLKIRYKPAQQKSAGSIDGAENIGQQPSNHLWVGNLPTRPNKLAIEELFGQFGTVLSVRVFPGKTFAFVNFDTVVHATAAMRFLDGNAYHTVSGTKPMVVRYQSGQVLAPPLNAMGVRLPGMPGLHSLPGRAPGAVAVPAHLQALGMHPQLGALPPPAMPRLPGAAPDLLQLHDASNLPALQAHLQSSGLDLEALLPAINLSNRLNPNNMHYDRDLADLYRNMTKVEKEALWADDRSQQQLLAMQGHEQLPADLSLLGLPPQQASLLSNHLAGGGSIDPWGGAGLPSAAPAHDWGGFAGLPSQASAGVPIFGQSGFQAQASASFSLPMSSSLLHQRLPSQLQPQASLAEALSSLGVHGQ